MPLSNTMKNVVQKSSWVCAVEMMMLFTGCAHAPEQDNNPNVWQDPQLYQTPLQSIKPSFNDD